MTENIKNLVEELIKSGKDFTLEEEQSGVRIWLENWSLVLSSNGKWRME